MVKPVITDDEHLQKRVIDILYTNKYAIVRVHRFYTYVVVITTVLI